MKIKIKVKHKTLVVKEVSSPTKPCINPCNFSFNNNAKVFSYESFVVPNGSDEVVRNHFSDETSMNAITSLRSGEGFIRYSSNKGK